MEVVANTPRIMEAPHDTFNDAAFPDNQGAELSFMHQNRRALALAGALIGFTGAAGAGLASPEEVLGQPDARAASARWTNLGGDPLVRGGVYTRNNFVRLMTSKKGTRAMRYAGLTPGQRIATRREARMGDFRSCSMRYGEHFDRMSFGINGTSVDRNVTFLDSRFRNRPAAAWCMDVVVGGRTPEERKVVKIKVPKLCGNVAVNKIVILIPRRPKVPVPPPPKIEQPPPKIPPPPKRPPPEQPPPPPQNRPPTGRGDVPHRFVSTVDRVCVDPSDPDGDTVTVSNFRFTNANTGASVGSILTGVYFVGSGDIQCVDWRAPDTPQSVIWMADLHDSRGAFANTPPDEIPVLANNTGPVQ